MPGDSPLLNILFIGDIVGKPGRNALARALRGLRQEHSVDLCIGNAENAAGGFGLTPEVADDLFGLGIDVLTSGNHIFDKREILERIAADKRILRPANYPRETPGAGSVAVRTSRGDMVGVLNLMGRVYMDTIDCPFKTADEEIGKLKKETDVVFVDMHAEVTSEKTAMGWYLDGRVSAVVGSHTHVQTADERILPKGTAYLTDAGMTGSADSVIGIKTENAISRFLTRLPRRMETANGRARIGGALVSVNRATGLAEKIVRVNFVPEAEGE
ncbi:MAG: TIGR00282 family metallophosphoesterase [Nitrospinae bacterium]|nr:TIGR00282 family metallophosphoesterase [Nitrospinota bacterium]